MNELKLKPIEAWTVNSSDDERRSSNKGVYRNYSEATKKAPNSGWYGSNGTVEKLKNIFEDENGDLYEVKPLGKSTDDKEKYELKMKQQISSKLTEEEIKFIKENKI